MKTRIQSAASALILLLSACGGGGTSNDTAPAIEVAAPAIPLKQTGKAEGVDFTVTSVATPSSIGPAGVGIKAETGETFVVVSYTIKNTATKTLPMTERPGVTLVDGAGQAYEPDMSATMMSAGLMDDASGMAADLNPKVSAKTKAAWKVDKAAFGNGAWKLVVATSPTLTFALK